MHSHMHAYLHMYIIHTFTCIHTFLHSFLYVASKLPCGRDARGAARCCLGGSVVLRQDKIVITIYIHIRLSVVLRLAYLLRVAATLT